MYFSGAKHLTEEVDDKCKDQAEEKKHGHGVCGAEEER